MVLASYQNHIKITTKLQNNNHSKLPEIELSRSYSYRIKEETTLRLVGRVEVQDGLFPLPCVVDKNQEGYINCGGPP